MNTYRRLLAEAIERNGGYSRGYHDRYPIEYDVSLWRADLDVDHVYKKMCETHGYLPPITGLEWDEEQIWRWTQEDLYHSLDCDAYRTYSTDTAKRFGLPYHRFPQRYKRRTNECAYYPAKLAGWRREDPYIPEYYDVKFELAGRGGKHLVVTEFQGRRLEGFSSDELAERIRESECETYSNVWCNRLLAMMHEWDKCFTPEAAADEMEYQAADRMYSEQYDRTQAWRKALKRARFDHAMAKAALI